MVIEIKVPSKWAYDFCKKYNIKAVNTHEQEIEGTWHKVMKVEIDLPDQQRMK